MPPELGAYLPSTPGEVLGAVCHDTFILKGEEEKCWHKLTRKMVEAPTLGVLTAGFGLFLKALLRQILG